jgi:hypothetical protein
MLIAFFLIINKLKETSAMPVNQLGQKGTTQASWLRPPNKNVFFKMGAP